MMKTFNGTEFILWVDTVTPLTDPRGDNEEYRPIVCGTTNGFNMDFESISFRNKCDGGWDHSESGYGSWGFNMDGQAIGIKGSEATEKANFDTIAQLALNKTRFWARMTDDQGTILREGKVRIGSYSESADMESPYAFTASFVGIGKPIIEDNIVIPETDNSIYLGPSGEVVDTLAEVLALNQIAMTTSPVDMNTGTTLRIFNIYFPQEYELASIQDITSDENLLDSYSLYHEVTIDGKVFKGYTMQNALTYNEAHTHRFTLQLA